jgi:hypothetical protein
VTELTAPFPETTQLLTDPAVAKGGVSNVAFASNEINGTGVGVTVGVEVGVGLTVGVGWRAHARVGASITATVIVIIRSHLINRMRWLLVTKAQARAKKGKAGERLGDTSPRHARGNLMWRPF